MVMSPWCVIGVEVVVDPGLGFSKRHSLRVSLFIFFFFCCCGGCDVLEIRDFFLSLFVYFVGAVRVPRGLWVCRRGEVQGCWGPTGAREELYMTLPEIMLRNPKIPPSGGGWR